MRPPEAKLAKELQSGFLDLPVTNAQGKKKVWDFWGLKVAPYLPGTSPKGQEGRMPLFGWQQARDLPGQFLASPEVWEWTMSSGLVSAGLSRG